MIRPRRVLPPELYWPGTMPSQAASCLPLSNSLALPIIATSAVDVVSPTPLTVLPDQWIVDGAYGAGRKNLIDYAKARQQGRRISSASAESVMNHVINRRMSKKQQMRWSMMGAHFLLQTRVEMLEGRLVEHFRARFPHFRSPELVRH